MPARGKALVIAFFAAILTPRGPLTWLDAARMFAPTAFVPASMLEDRWQSGLPTPWNASFAAAVVIWAITTLGLAQSRSARSFGRWLMLAIPPISVLITHANIAPAAIWTSITWLALAQSNSTGRSQMRLMWVWPAGVLVTLLAIVDASGMLFPQSRAISWGISQAIDPRLLDLSEVIPGNDPVIAWAADSRSAGVAAWANTKTKLVDHPTRALLGGRSVLHAGINRDLRLAHRSKYRLDDGSWGGWGRPFAEWKVEILYLPGEADDLHRGLAETPWKLIKLDSPTVPYALAEKPRFDRAIVEVIRQQDYVEAGSWQPSIEVYDPRGWRIDASILIGQGPSPLPAIRQSKFFQLVKLPMAALRALAPVRIGGGSSDVALHLAND